MCRILLLLLCVIIQDMDGDLLTVCCPAFYRLITINLLFVSCNQEILVHNDECVRAFPFLSVYYIFANNNELSQCEFWRLVHGKMSKPAQ